MKRNDQPMKGYWWFPGGRILKGELVIEAARRKAREEVGLAPKKLSIVGVYETIFPKGPSGVHSVNIVVSAYVSRSAFLDCDNHHIGAQWHIRPPRDFGRYLRTALNDARKALKH